MMMLMMMMIIIIMMIIKPTIQQSQSTFMKRVNISINRMKDLETEMKWN